MDSTFLRDISDVYLEQSVYRSIIVTNNFKEAHKYERFLTDNEHSVYFLQNINPYDYNRIDQRIVICDIHMFQKFLEYIEDVNGGIINSSFNFIAFSYNIDKEIIQENIEWYMEKTNNNINKTYFLEKNMF